MKKIIIIFLLLCCYSKSFSQTKSIKNLVLEGGGIRGIAYVGAIDELQSNHALDSIQNYAGTSAGSILAALLSVNYSSDELKLILSNVKFQKFNDNEFGFISGSKRMIRKYGWYKGNKFENFIEKLIFQKTNFQNFTLLQLHQQHLAHPDKFKDLFLTATDLVSQQAVVISYQNYPNMPISKAVRCSMSIPFYFKPVVWNYVDKDFSEIHYQQILVDGGVLMNYPIAIFDKQYLPNQTLGLRLDDSIESFNYNKQIAPNKNNSNQLEIKNIKDFTMDFYYLIMTSLNDKNLTSEDEKRTIQISPGSIGQKIKKLKNNEVELLVNNGRMAVKNFLKK
jgi:NTE family protein